MAQAMLASKYNYGRAPRAARIATGKPVAKVNTSSIRLDACETAISRYFVESTIVATSREGEVTRFRVTGENLFGILASTVKTVEEEEALLASPESFRETVLRLMGHGHRGRVVFLKIKRPRAS
jgi:hypothetical protein